MDQVVPTTPPLMAVRYRFTALKMAEPNKIHWWFRVVNSNRFALAGGTPLGPPLDLPVYES